MKRKLQSKYNSRYEIFIESTVKWLELHICKSGRLSLGLEVTRKYLTVLRTRGKKEAITFCKEARASILLWLSKSDIPKSSLASPRQCGVPLFLRSFLRDAKDDKVYPIIRLVLSALYASRELTLPVVPNVASIEGPHKGGNPDFTGYVKGFWSELGFNPLYNGNVPKVVYFKAFHLSTKTGPNGHAMWSAFADFLALPDDLYESIRIVGGKRLGRIMGVLRSLGSENSLFRFFTGVSGRRFRKISAIQSQEGKTREVAILDYWSQTCLRGLHQYLFGVLKRISQDCTFNQGSFLDKLPKPGPGVKFYSVDLTAATDRFPIDLIELVLQGRFSNDYVKHWRNIMVGHPFETTSHGSIRYAVGNPMGAYSSWNSFALTHHFLVYSCCVDLGLNWRDSPYVLLGDDIVIANELLANRYMERLVEIGVEFSPTKTHVSDIMYEFAKRTVYNGIELTPFPIAALWTTRKSLSLMLNVVDSEGGKGWTELSKNPVILAELLPLLRISRSRVRRMKESMFAAMCVLNGFKGRASALEVLTPLVERISPLLLPQLDEGTANSLFRHVVIESLMGSVNTLRGIGAKRNPWKLIEDLVVHVSGLIYNVNIATDAVVSDRTTLEDPSLLFEAVPVISVFRQIGERTSLLLAQASDLQYLMTGDWKLMIRSLILPESDKIFYARNQDLLSQASFTLSKKLTKILSRCALDPLGITPFGTNAYFPDLASYT